MRDESISDYMHRARLLVLEAHNDLAHASRERILITRLLLWRYNRQLASAIAVVKIQTAADAQRLAADSVAVRRDQRSRSSTNNFLLNKLSAHDPGSVQQALGCEAFRQRRKGAHGSSRNAQLTSKESQFKLVPSRMAQSNNRNKMLQLRPLWPLEVVLPSTKLTRTQASYP